ncbi:MAG: hypothetical protein K2K37_10675 [Muribaculaceae bacterium]|nr:hypothetical protein [Muribaculaceae bacterium]
MKKFIFRAVGFSCILFIAFVIIALIGAWYAKRNHVYLEGYELKERLLIDKKSPRIIFQGGSNVAFGINSKEVEDSLHVNTINVAIHAGLGLRLMLSVVSDYCRDGDILVLSPEYEHFYGVAYGSGETMAMLTLLYPKTTKYFNIKQALQAIRGIPSTFKIMNTQLIKSIGNISHNTQIDNQTDSLSDHYTYSSLSFNSRGDEEKHWKYPNDHFVIKTEHFVHSFDEKFFEEFCRTIEALEARGINVIIIPPAVSSMYFHHEKEKIDYVAERLLKARHPFAYNQELSTYDKSDLFDTAYHLSKSGIDKRMNLIINLMKSLQQ